MQKQPRVFIKPQQLGELRVLGMEEAKAVLYAERMAKQAVDIAVNWRFCSYQPPSKEKQGFEIFYPKKLDLDYPATGYKGTGELLSLGFLYIWFDSVEAYNVFIGRNPDGSERLQLIIKDSVDDEDDLAPVTDWADSIGETYVPLGTLMTDTMAVLTEEERKKTHELINVRWTIGSPYKKTVINQDGSFNMRPSRASVVDRSIEGLDGDVLIAAEKLPEWFDVEKLQDKLDRYNTTPDYEPEIYFTNDGFLVVKYSPGSNDAYAAHVMMSTFMANDVRIHFNMPKIKIEKRTPPRRVDSPVASSTPPESPAREMSFRGRGGKSPYREPKSPKKPVETEDGWKTSTKASTPSGRGKRGQRSRK